MRETPGYSKNDLGGGRASRVTYGQAWGMAVERGVMYVKIDDDIVSFFAFCFCYWLGGYGRAS